MTPLKRFQDALRAKDVDAFFIAAPETLSSANLRYLSGFSGSSAYICVTSERAWLITDSRYIEQARQECPQFEVVGQKGPAVEVVRQLAGDYQWHRLGFEASHVTYQMWREWQNRVEVPWQPFENLVESLRIIKTPEEINLIRQAADIADQALASVLEHVVGRREMDIALDLEDTIRRSGVVEVAFPTIVASGPRGAMPHAHPSERVVAAGEFVTIDFGASCQGYNSDETVTIATGEVSRELRHVFDVVFEAQRAGMERVRAGTSAQEIDRAARQVIAAAGYGQYFGHGTGHGVGIEVHEDPYASPGSSHTLASGMTLTVEPGIYLPGVGGVRLEDTLVVTDTGFQRLTAWPKAFTW